MPSVQHQALELLVKNSLKPVCSSPGPFITVYLPACHPGASDLPRSPRLKAILRSAAAELERRRYRGAIDQLLAPLEEVANDPAAMAGAGDSVMFSSPAFFQHYRVPSRAGERMAVATHAHVTPLLPSLIHYEEFYVMGISRKRLRLGHWSAGHCEEIPLPPSVPESLAAFGGFDRPDHDLENRSAAGASNGQMRGVVFGTSADREKDNDYLHNYFRLVDRELRTILGTAPLVVIGVDYELAAYRKAAEYAQVFHARPTSPDYLTWAEMGVRAQEALAEKTQSEAEHALKEFREATRRDRVVSDVRKVLEAAHEGRVYRLLLAKGAEYQDLLGPLYPMTPNSVEGAQDLLNTAAVETIRAGGEIHLLDPLQLAGAGPIAAVLRYSRQQNA
jgi:hypothetical protein